MISYEELCRALERQKTDQSNDAEMAPLDNGADPGASVQDMAANAPEEFAAAQALQAQESQLAAVQDEPQDLEPDFATQPPEDTHEIDVDEVVSDDDDSPYSSH